MISILIVDDHKLVRAGIAQVLRQERGMHIVGEAESGEAAIDLVQRLHPNVVLMDLRMPGIGGLEATRRICRMNADVRVIVLTMCDDEPFPTQMLRAGAMGYLTKASSATEVVRAIRKVHVGQRYVSADVARRMALRQFDGDAASPFATLSAREMQIALMVADCQRAHEIAERLHLSPKTVNSYRYRIFDKLSVTSDVELALLAMQHGIGGSDHRVPRGVATAG
jgi:DNA-binding NarL/FixJ family response regulator